MKRIWIALSLAAALHASHAQAPSEASALSLTLPVALSVQGTVALSDAGAALSVASVHASAEGTTWVIERASDGARFAVRFGPELAGRASVTAGAALTATTLASGMLLSMAGEAVAFVPNRIGKALLHHQRLTR